MVREKREKPAKEPKPGKAKTSAQGSSWTQGRSAGATLATALLLAAIICGPLGLFVAMGKSSASTATAAPTTAAGLTTTQQEAGSYALGYVGAWLGATQTDPGDLGDYVDTTAIGSLTQTPWKYRDLIVASVTPVSSSSFVNVVVAASVQQNTKSSSGGEASVWPRRYFQVAVWLSPGTMRVVGLPAPIAGPVQGSSVNLTYQSQVTKTDPAGQTISAFLTAYLTGADVSVYTTPGVALAAVMPAPYVSVDTTMIAVDKTPTNPPSNGSKLRALATATVTSSQGQELVATWALTLTARAGRWEVTAIDLAPQASPSQGTATPSPSPTGGTTTGGN